MAGAAPPVAAAGSRGPKWTTAECNLLCKAFVAASEDAAEGTDQTSAEFQEKTHQKYILLLQQHNTEHGTNFPPRKAHSNFNQFRKISKLVLKYKSVEDNAGDPPSGDNDKAVFLEGIKNTFKKWHGKECGNMLEAIVSCKEFLKGSPKWADFEAKIEEKNTKKRKTTRPPGNKVAKQQKKDEAIVKNVLQISSDEQEKKDHRRNKDLFMQKIGTGMDALATCLADRNDQQLLEYLSPESRKNCARQLLEERLKRMKAQNSTSFIRPETKSSSVISSLTTDGSDTDGTGSPVQVEKVVPAEVATAGESPTDMRLLREMQARIKAEKNDDNDTDNDGEEDLYA
ncbi:hypothetical protein SEMRO_3255_G345900.1 [Seminavis robusta]|uniref:No apical meristem-associated C-terminal domain-containing protein n=1 Tax=Seminavis robusta TaxID=568900 RepID=A0A9N8HZ61_9STRA|nr:hypothetical protein SEMRO_3255_G345900.1 [Seminavis robusta]|eukprot:Sro3255_g345900.1 n/a (342) ;mRNA; r:3682-4707